MKLVWKILIVLAIILCICAIIALVILRRMIFGGYSKQPFKNVWEDTNKHGEKYKDVLMQMITSMNKIFEEHNMPYFFIFGNLIGVIRHNGLIPWDDDVDIAMHNDDCIKLMKLHKEFRKAGLGIEKTNVITTQIIKIYPLSEKSVLSPIWKFSWPFIDIFSYKDKSEDSIYIRGTDGLNDIQIFKKDDIFPLKPYNLYGVDVNIPNKPEKILDQLYPGWDKLCYSSPLIHRYHSRIKNRKKIPTSQLQDIDNKVFEYVWIISTDKDKREKVQEKLSDIDILAHVWPGVKTDSRAFLDVYEEFNNDKVSKEELASLLSHYSLWEYLQEKDYPYAIILENDITFSPNITKQLLLQELNESAGFVLLFLGHSREKLVKKPSTYLGHSNGRHAYAVSKTGISQLCDLGNSVISNINNMTNKICKTELCFLSHTDEKRGNNKGGGIIFKQRTV